MKTPQLFLALAVAVSMAAPAAWSWPGFNHSNWGNRSPLSGVVSSTGTGLTGTGLTGTGSGISNALRHFGGLGNGTAFANNNGYHRGLMNRFLPASNPVQNVAYGSNAAYGSGYGSGYGSNYGGGYCPNMGAMGSGMISPMAGMGSPMGMMSPMSGISSMLGGGGGYSPYSSGYGNSGYGNSGYGQMAMNPYSSGMMGQHHHHHHRFMM